VRAFITGVTGFAGSHLAEHLLASGDAVMGCSRNAAWPKGTPARLSEQVPLLAWDVAREAGPNQRAELAAFAPDAIYHLAAMATPEACGHDAPSEDASAVNVEGTRRVLELAASLGEPARILFTSSCHVYGEVDREKPVVTEDAPVRPIQGYGKTKQAAEEIVLRYASTRGIECVIARSFHHAGPRQSPQMVLSDWGRQFASSRQNPIRVVCRDAWLDLTDVRDIVRAYRSLVLSGESGLVYNVGSGKCSRSGDLLELMQQASGADRKIVELTPGHQQLPVADVSRIVACTGWRPTVPLETTVKDTLTFWLERNAQI